MQIRKISSCRILSLFLALVLMFNLSAFSVRADAPDKAPAGSEESLLSAPVIEEDASGGTQISYDTIYFGEYPQAMVVDDPAYDGDAAGFYLYDEDLYAALVNTSEWDDDGDAEIDGEWYRRVQADNESYIPEFLYFKYQPILWRVLAIDGIEYDNGNTIQAALLLSDKILDVKPFDKGGFGVWEESSIREWLNGDFERVVFDSEVSYNDILNVMEEATDGDFEAYEGEAEYTTEDIFLLSGAEAFGADGEDFGFLRSPDDTYASAEEDPAREAIPTGYAVMQSGLDKAGYWWLRSTAVNNDENAMAVDILGGAAEWNKAESGDSCYGIRPALWLNIEEAEGDYEYAGKTSIDIVGGGSEPEPEKEPKTEPETKEGEGKESQGGRLSEAALYLSGQWFLARFMAEDFDDSVTEQVELTELSETLPGSWCIYAETDIYNPANESYDLDTGESETDLSVSYMKADIDGSGDEFEMLLDTGEYFDITTGKIYQDGLKEELDGELSEESARFSGNMQVTIYRILSYDGRLFGVGELLYPSGETLNLCMVREAGIDGTDSKEKKEPEPEKKTEKSDRHSDEIGDYPVLWGTFNISGVQNEPTEETAFTLTDGTFYINSITTYHWNHGEGSTPGQISLVKDGEIIGTWDAVGRGGSGAENVNWDVFPDIEIEPGDYEIIDSDPETWSCNEESRYRGFAELRGEEVLSDTTEATGNTGGTEDVIIDAAIDLKDYHDEYIREYGGNLEEVLAEALDSKVEEGEDSRLICDGAIEFFPTVDGSGFFVWLYEPVENYTVYGLTVGMTEEEALSVLETEGLEYDEGFENGIYSDDFSDYYITYDLAGGKLSKVTYVKII